MIVQIKRFTYLLFIFCVTVQTVFSQNYASRDNYAGDWETPTTWTPTWPVPQTSVSGRDITINGYIILNGSLSFSGNPNTLTVNDTLVVRGNLVLGNNNDIVINDNGILIVQGNFTMNNQTIVKANGYLIITGDFTKNSAQGSLTSNDNPVKVFIGGKISPTGLTSNNAAFQALNCTAPVTTRHPGSNCSYGNMTDLINDPIYPFFQSTIYKV